MAEKYPITPYVLFVMGEWVGAIKNELAQVTTYYEPINEPLVGLTISKDSKNLGFIGKEAEGLWKELYDKYSQESASVDSKDIENLKRTVTRWEGRLQEVSKNWVLSYPDTHIDASKLNEGPIAFLSPEEFVMLEPPEGQSLREATSSLLFTNFISAEFMALRAGESLLKRWYEKRTGKKLGRTTWGQVLEKINDEFPKEKERPKELLLLDYLRERRNEIAHPEAVSNSVQASTTFLNVISLCQTLYFKQD